MKAKMVIFAPLCLLLCWMLPVCSKEISYISRREVRSSREMSMVEDAVDDMYLGCREAMAKMVKDKYFKKENTGDFEMVWKEAESCANDRLRSKDPEDQALTKDHMQAICVYTSLYKEFYKTFNAEIRRGMHTYNTVFQFHSLHFWLTSALQILNGNRNCHTTYRKTNSETIGKVNQIIRFGFFASSSKETTLTSFGNKTCFKIRTCSGAFLKHYSAQNDTEQEVLIPPYEQFNITKNTNGVEGLQDCEVVYILESAGHHSNLNCNAASSTG